MEDTPKEPNGHAYIRTPAEFLEAYKRFYTAVFEPATTQSQMEDAFYEVFANYYSPPFHRMWFRLSMLDSFEPETADNKRRDRALSKTVKEFNSYFSVLETEYSLLQLKASDLNIRGIVHHTKDLLEMIVEQCDETDITAVNATPD
jgi:hypothetical protein